MKTWKKISAMLLSFGMLLSLLAAVPASAAAPTTGSIQVHKYLVETKEQYDQLKEKGDISGGNEIKGDSVINELKPMEGVTFELIKVIDEGKDMLNPETAREDTRFTKKTETTDKDGNITFSELPFGTYKLTELDDPRVQEHMKPVLISVPTYNQAYKDDPKNKQEFLYDIHVYPKNLINQEGPDIKKDVVKEENDHATVDRYAPFNWIILSGIPDEVKEENQAAKKYVIMDPLDHRLDFVEDVSVELRSKDKTKKETLVKDTHYTFTAEKIEGKDYKEDNTNYLTWTLTADGLARLKEYAGGEVVTTFKTKLNEKAEVATAIPNQAKLEYKNWNNKVYIPESDIPEVHTGGIKIKKVDKANHNTLLEGAKFMIYRSEADAKEGDSKKAIQRNGAPYEVTSDDKGIAFFEGLAYGDDGNIGQTVEQGATDYWIVETEAPTLNGVKYNRLKDPFQVTVNSTSHNVTDNMYVVYNAKDNYELPFTGGTGLLVFLGGGAALLAAAYLISKSGKNKTAK